MGWDAEERGGEGTGVLTGVAVCGGHVEDGVGAVVLDGVEGAGVEGGDKVRDVGQVAEAATEQDVFAVLVRGWHMVDD